MLMQGESKLAITEGWVSILVNIVLFALKYWAGVVTGSLALMADAWHTLSDSISSLFVIIGVKISYKPADKKHPFGHGRSELVTSILIGALLAFIAFYFFQEGIIKLYSRQMVHYGAVAVVVTIVSILMKEGLAQYAFFIGRKCGSQSVVADGWHHRSDSLSSVIVLVGIFFGKYFWWIDGVLGIVVAILIFRAAYKVILDSAGTILGEQPSDEIITQIEQIVDQCGGGAMNPHHYHLHNYVRRRELTFHIRFPNAMCIEDAHRIVSEIESQIALKLNINATIHIEPYLTSKGCKHVD
ncbi:MAG: cation transporter [Bacteroidales bacterium]|nr:cation transporter [Bacteroidales bacterium]